MRRGQRSCLVRVRTHHHLPRSCHLAPEIHSTVNKAKSATNKQHAYFFIYGDLVPNLVLVLSILIIQALSDAKTLNQSCPMLDDAFFFLLLFFFFRRLGRFPIRLGFAEGVSTREIPITYVFEFQ